MSSWSLFESYIQYQQRYNAHPPILTEPTYYAQARLPPRSRRLGYWLPSSLGYNMYYASSTSDGPTRQQGVGQLGQLAQIYYPACTLRNDRLPIHRLPTELLSHIFLLAVTPRDLERMPGRLPIAKVCTLWRVIVITTPDFWTTISNKSSERLVRLKLRRSGNVKLDFVYSESPPSLLSSYPRWFTPTTPFNKQLLDDSQFKWLIRPHMWRCRSFRLRVLKELADFSWICPEHQDSTIPQLAIEPISTHGRQGCVWVTHLPTGVQSLHLAHVELRWPSICFPSLTSLQLSGTWGPTFSRFSTRIHGSNLVVTLSRACPQLRTLKLGPFNESYDTAGLRDQDELNLLPHLEVLEMRGPSAALFRKVLDEIDVSRLSKLCIYTTNLGPVSCRMAATLFRDVGGRSLLQSAIKSVDCERLTLSIGTGPTEWIRLRGVNRTETRIHLELLGRDSSWTTARAVLAAINDPVDIELFGQANARFIRSLRHTSTVASICRRPYRGSGVYIDNL